MRYGSQLRGIEVIILAVEGEGDALVERAFDAADALAQCQAITGLQMSRATAVGMAKRVDIVDCLHSGCDLLFQVGLTGPSLDLL